MAKAVEKPKKKNPLISFILAIKEQVEGTKSGAKIDKKKFAKIALKKVGVKLPDTDAVNLTSMVLRFRKDVTISRGPGGGAKKV